MKHYPLIGAVVRHGRRLSAARAISAGALRVLRLVKPAAPAEITIALDLITGAVVGAVCYFPLRLGAEIVEVVSDTLLPR